LLIAIKNKFVPVVKVLIQNGADNNYTDKSGNTPLNLAIQNNSIPIVTLLLESGSQVNQLNDLNEGPLLLAAKLGNRIVCERLIEQGADIFTESNEGISPVWYAVGANLKELVALFLKKGLSPDYARSVDAWDGKDGHYMQKLIANTGTRTFILGFEPHYAGETLLQTASKLGYLSLAKLLLDSGAEIDKQDASGNTALHYASAYGKKDFLRFLLTNGAKTDIANVLEQKAIDYSNMNGFNEITSLLIEFGAKTNAIEDGEVSKPVQPTIKDMADKKKALLDMKELLDAGILTQEEFDAEKKKILEA